ncbi:hypothetical protein, partial [Acidipropionibacterium jensenii]|uniref:hypothetical protein n=1 Tax=Acidipropionibacterium jensenii TaxID=1749 RepID=UPI002649F408
MLYQLSHVRMFPVGDPPGDGKKQYPTAAGGANLLAPSPGEGTQPDDADAIGVRVRLDMTAEVWHNLPPLGGWRSGSALRSHRRGR